MERDRSALLVPVWLDRTSAWAKRLLLIGAALLAVLWVALQVRVALVPFLVALLVASALRPLADRLERFGTPRAIAAAIPIASVGVLVGLAGWFTYARASTMLSGDSLTEDDIRSSVTDWLSGEPLELSPDQIDEAERSIRSWLSNGAGSFGVAEATVVVQVLGGAVLALVLTFFLVKDGPTMWSAIVERVDPVRRAGVERAGHAVTDTMSAYLRSIVITGLADAVLIGIGLWILGVPLVIPLVLLTAVGGLFPLVGAVAAGAAATVVALIAEGPTTAIWVIVLTLVVQQVEGNVLQPLIVSRQVSIHPVVVLVSLAAGGAVAGLPGAFLAVPVVAASIAAVRAFSAELDHQSSTATPDTDVDSARS